MTQLHCPECGFRNHEAANYCEKCGALLIPEESGQTTMSLVPDESEEEPGGAVAELWVERGQAIIVRSGGGRAGESHLIDRDRLTIGRSPDSDVFLDDVTVSRQHAVLARRGERVTIEDLGSLNGTFVNRRRVDALTLEDGDEIQIGKYKLTFLER